jgi:hypothetical protein
MQAHQPDSNPAMARLAALAGEWAQEVDVAGVPAGRTVFEPVLGGSFLLQRNEIPHPGFPDFAQGFTGSFQDESTITGAWEHSDDGVTWKRDVGLSFKKIG